MLDELRLSMLMAAPDLDSSLLSKAFRGVLIEQDPNDEPASVMLERLAAERTANTETQSKRGTKVATKPSKRSTNS